MPINECADIPAFLAQLRARSLTAAVIAWQDEFGPVALPGGGAEYRAVRSLVLLAYDEGVIIRCELTESLADRVQVLEQLTAAGITSTLRCRNLQGEPGRGLG